MIISTPNTAGLKTSAVLWVTSSKRSFKLNNRPCFVCAWANRRSAFSTTITAPSTIKPKSIAPRLIRLPETLLAAIPVIANNILSGITIAVINAALKLPSNANKITITKMAPSSRFCCTVAIVLSTSVVRLYIAWAITPSGRLKFTWVNLSATAWETVLLFSPINIKAVPKTVSLPFWVAAPVLSCLPSLTKATSFILTGASSRFVITIFAISFILFNCPGERTNHCSPLRSM